jgi:hypothetical protein
MPAASRPALGHIQPPIQWVPAVLSLRLKWPGLIADNSPSSSANNKNVGYYTPIPPRRLHGAMLN